MLLKCRHKLGKRKQNSKNGQLALNSKQRKKTNLLGETTYGEWQKRVKGLGRGNKVRLAHLPEEERRKLGAMEEGCAPPEEGR